MEVLKWQKGKETFKPDCSSGVINANAVEIASDFLIGEMVATAWNCTSGVELYAVRGWNIWCFRQPGAAETQINFLTFRWDGSEITSVQPQEQPCSHFLAIFHIPSRRSSLEAQTARQKNQCMQSNRINFAHILWQLWVIAVLKYIGQLDWALANPVHEPA